MAGAGPGHGTSQPRCQEKRAVEQLLPPPETPQPRPAPPPPADRRDGAARRRAVTAAPGSCARPPRRASRAARACGRPVAASAGRRRARRRRSRHRAAAGSCRAANAVTDAGEPARCGVPPAARRVALGPKRRKPNGSGCKRQQPDLLGQLVRYRSRASISAPEASSTASRPGRSPMPRRRRSDCATLKQRKVGCILVKP